MASLIPGFEYDIFISYRQKDNKYDGWVTEFIDHLKREIEATFKEDVSIYFDENPHDGLLEIHNVDKSLETKLNSVIFMPIISQTYCDPGSFAWQHEFLAFNKMSLADPLGKDIKLPSGNVCSRIIPIKIHDLDNTDTELLETEMGCRLRAIEFIYSGAGVNRPLKPDDNPDKNLNRTFYRDQINKVANTVKEIIYSVHPDEKKRSVKSYQTRASVYHPETTPAMPVNKVKRSKLARRIAVTGSISGLIIILLAVLLPEILKRSGSGTSQAGKNSKAIAVMPVTNYTGNPDLEWIAEMIQNDLTGQLQRISNLVVRPKQTTLEFKNSEASLEEIAKKLSVNNFIESSIKGSEENLQVEVRIVETYPEARYIYQSSFSQSFNELAGIYSEIINKILKGLQVKATEQEEKVISASNSVNPEVRKLCARGQYQLNLLTPEGFELGVKYYKDAIATDPADPEPYIGLALGYSNAGHATGTGEDAANLAKAYALKAIELDPEEAHPSLADAHVVLATRYLYTEWDFVKAEYHLKRAITLNPNSPAAHYTYGWYLALPGKINEAADEMRKAAAIDPLDPICPGYLAWLYLWIGQYEDAEKEALNTLKVNPDYPMAYYVLGLSYAGMKRYDEAIETEKKIYNPGSGFANGLAIAYARAGRVDKALGIAGEMEKQNMRWHSWGLAEIYAALGDKDKAIYWLEEAYKQRHDFIPWIQQGAFFQSCADQPRFQKIIRSLNLPEI